MAGRCSGPLASVTAAHCAARWRSLRRTRSFDPAPGSAIIGSGQQILLQSEWRPDGSRHHLPVPTRWRAFALVAGSPQAARALDAVVAGPPGLFSHGAQSPVERGPVDG
jgi:hypothetical protein